MVGNSVVKISMKKMDENQRERAGSNGGENGTKVKPETSTSNESVSVARIIPNVSF